MKFFVCLAFAFAFVAYAVATPAGSSSSGSSSSVSGSNVQEVESEAQQKPVQAPVVELTRLRKAAYGGGGSSGGYGGSSGGYGGGSVSIPAPPCPKNYLFSCQPNLAPIACSSPSSSYGSAGAYSAPVPTYVTPFRGNYGVPQNFASYVPQGFAYNNNNNKQYYQY